jgi:hypothetical protein
MTGNPEVMPRMDSQRRWPEVAFEEVEPRGIGDIVSGVSTRVLTEHSKTFSYNYKPGCGWTEVGRRSIQNHLHLDATCCSGICS